ncbi:MAG: DUF4416 family protein [Candidatus Dadabacteria bacterium]|nr:MAG: DUF4416 family protein [Candidatus Dadabacteria bacterium]
MGELSLYRPVLPFVTVMSREEQVIKQALGEIEKREGEIECCSDLMDFNFTDYYQRDMGKELKFCFAVLSDLQNPFNLAARKILSNKIESLLAKTSQVAVTRPVNIDPGYISELQLVLASTKFAPHRLAVGEGIWAEVTMLYQNGGWQELPWSYPSYSTEESKKFFKSARKLVLRKLASKSLRRKTGG